MATRFAVQAECNHRNRQGRQVQITATFTQDRFWNRGQLGDFLVAGGGQEDWASAVTSYTQESLRRSLKPVIILDGTGALERRLISLYTTGSGSGRGTLRVYSPEYRGYDVFGNMNPYAALQYLTDATKDRPRESEISPAYIEAFLSVVRRVMPIALDGMRQLANKTDEEIRQVAQHTGVEYRHVEMLRNPGQNGRNFRTFLGELENAFSNVWNRNTAAGNNIFGDLGTGGIIYINAQSSRPALFNKYFSTVLDYISNSRYLSFDVILYGVTFCHDDGLLKHLEDATRRPNETIGVCCSNISSLIHQYPFICDMPRHIIFTSSRSMAPAELLRSYGPYDYFFPKREYAPGLFPLPWDNNWEIGFTQRDRVKITDLNENNVGKIMKGYNGEEIALVRNP